MAFNCCILFLVKFVHMCPTLQPNLSRVWYQTSSLPGSRNVFVFIPLIGVCVPYYIVHNNQYNSSKSYCNHVNILILAWLKVKVTTVEEKIMWYYFMTISPIFNCQLPKKKVILVASWKFC